MDESKFQRPNFLQPAPREPFEAYVENPELLVPEGKDIAPGWMPWAAEDRGFRPPQFAGIEFGKQRTQGFHAEFRYDAGLWQSVEVLPDIVVTFTMDFQIRSNHQAPSDTWPEGLLVGVGIDPYGREDPRSETVQWALRDLRYNETVSASVSAIARNEKVTVFVRNVALIPGSDAMAGYGTLQQCAQTCTREMYTRTYLLLPNNANLALWQKAVAVASVPDRKWTVGTSADDAGLGQYTLLKRKIIAVDAAEWNPPLDAQWFHTHYPPGSNLIFREVSSAQLNNSDALIFTQLNNL